MLFTADLVSKHETLLQSIFAESDVNSKLSILNDALLSTLQTHAPVKTIRVRNRPCPYITQNMVRYRLVSLDTFKEYIFFTSKCCFAPHRQNSKKWPRANQPVSLNISDAKSYFIALSCPPFCLLDFDRNS
jgi:hypothetical protein